MKVSWGLRTGRENGDLRAGEGLIRSADKK